MAPQETGNQDAQQEEKPRHAPPGRDAPPSGGTADETTADRDPKPQRGETPRWKTITDPPPV